TLYPFFPYVERKNVAPSTRSCQNCNAPPLARKRTATRRRCPIHEFNDYLICADAQPAPRAQPINPRWHQIRGAQRAPRTPAPNYRSWSSGGAAVVAGWHVDFRTPVGLFLALL